MLDEHSRLNCAAVDRLGTVVLMNHADSLSFALVARLAERCDALCAFVFTMR